MGYSWVKLIRDEFGREGARQTFALVLMVATLAGIFAFVFSNPPTVNSWTTDVNFIL